MMHHFSGSIRPIRFARNKHLPSNMLKGIGRIRPYIGPNAYERAESKAYRAGLPRRGFTFDKWLRRFLTPEEMAALFGQGTDTEYSHMARVMWRGTKDRSRSASEAVVAALQTESEGTDILGWPAEQAAREEWTSTGQVSEFNAIQAILRSGETLPPLAYPRGPRYPLGVRPEPFRG